MGVMAKVNRLVNPFLTTKVSSIGKRVATYTQYYKTEDIQSKTILYESRDGKSLTDSPFAIFEYLLEKDQDKEYTHIWSVQPTDELRYFMNRYQGVTNVHFVTRNSDEYLKWLTKAEYLINNATFQSFVTIKKEQTYINTWHGTPLKTMGFDIPGHPNVAKNVVRNFFMADVLISPNQHTTNMFLDSFKLRHNYQGEILEGGYPRIDQTFSKNHDDTIRTLHDRGVQLDLSKDVMLYCPTWKGGSEAYINNELQQIIHESAILREKYGDSYNVLVKVHPFLYDKASQEKKLIPYLVLDGMDTNKVLGLVDLLITDYSSIFFDFLVTGKPIVFYCWDDDLYSNERGKYFEYDELPGPVAFNLSELCDILDNLDQKLEETQWNYDRFTRLYVPYDDGHVTKRYVDYLFFSQPLSDKVTQIIQPKDKIRLLIYPGGLRKNGITSSFLNLVSMIDYDKYAVTCLLDVGTIGERSENIRALPKEVSFLFRFGLPLYTLKESYQDLYYHMNGVKKGKEENFPMAVYEREVTRLLGNQTYDTSIDFSGYSLYWTKLILATQANKKVCYLHSDMLKDMNRVVNGRKIHKMNVKGIMSVYDRYDELVSVSKVIRDINQDNLTQFADARKFTYAENVINVESLMNKPEVIVKENNETNTLFRQAKIKDLEASHDLYNTRPDSSYAYLSQVDFKTPDVFVLGTYMFDGVTYAKITQNYQYLGWIKLTDIDILDDMIIKEEVIDKFGKFDLTRPGHIYTQPVGLSESQEKSGNKTFNKVYMTASKRAITLTDTSLQINVGNTLIGWIPEREFKATHVLNAKGSLPKKMMTNTLRFILKNSFRKQQADIKKVSDVTASLEEYVKVTQDMIARSQMSEDSSSMPLPKGELIYLEKVYTKGNENWVFLSLSDGSQWYILKENLHVTKEFKREVIKRVETSYDIIIPSHEITAYANIQQVIDQKGILVSAMPEARVLEIAELTDGDSYVHLDVEDTKIWVSQSDVRLNTDTAVLNTEGISVSYPNPNVPNFVTVGRLSKEKNQALLIESFKQLSLDYPNAHLYIIGEGPERENLELLIKNLDLANQVTLTGQINHPYDFVAQCDTFVLTSDYEGQSLVLLEAMTLGNKVISTDIPACRQVLEDGRLGMLTKTNDVDGVYQAMLLSLDDKVSFETFDVTIYTNQAIESFDAVTGLVVK